MSYTSYYNDQFGELGCSVAQKWPEKDIIRKKGKTNSTLGLALSGGGYRSAIFNYGVLKGIHKLGLIRKFGLFERCFRWFMDCDAIFDDQSPQVVF